MHIFITQHVIHTSCTFSPSLFKKFDVRLKSCGRRHCHWVSSPKHLKEHGTFIFRVKQFKNAGNILPSTLHHIPVKLNHQQHCCDILRSHKIYAFCGTRICYHVMVCHWNFTVGYMSPFCTFTKCFIPIQDEPL